jgi:predicted peptidase
MRRTIALFTALCGLGVAGLTSWAQEPTPDSMQRAKSFRRKITSTVSARYLLFLPKDYDAKRTKPWPLILFLHGAGERGTNLGLVAKHGPPKIVKDRPDFPFIVVSPQCPPGECWNNDLLLALLETVTSAYRVDTGRIYLTGLSMGGFGTWSLGLAYPEKFAALAPICGGGDTIPVLLAPPKKLQALKTLPIWAFHGARDSAVNLAESQRMVEAVNQAGGQAKLTVYPEAEHDSWTETYGNPDLYTWFLQHTRKPGAAKPGRRPGRQTGD